MNTSSTIAAVLSEHPFVRSMSREQLEILSQGATQCVFEPGQVIFKQCDPANRFYLLIDGKVALEAHQPAGGDTEIQTLGSGEVLGWSWLFPPFTWHFQARAVERTTVISLDGAHLLVASNQNHEFGHELMKRVTQVVIQRLQATRKRFLQEPSDCKPA